MVELSGQLCPVCGEKKATLREEQLDIPHFGKVFVLSLECAACGYRKSDVEPAEEKEPARYTLELSGEEDLSIKVVKSSEATVKIPHIITMEGGPAAEGYVTNIEGLLERVKKAIESAVNDEEDEDARKKAKNLLKKINNALVGREKLKIIIEDMTGHSVIISEKAQKSKL